MSTNQLRILKKAKCPSTSGKSTLTYHIGANDEGNVFFCIAENNGGGFFSAEWVALEDIQQALEKPEEISSVALYGLFKGKSVNTPAFLLAVLKAEKLIQTIKGKRRKHELCDLSDFQARIDKLMSGESKPKTTRKKAAVKKKATPRKRATR